MTWPSAARSPYVTGVESITRECDLILASVSVSISNCKFHPWCTYSYTLVLQWRYQCNA